MLNNVSAPPRVPPAARAPGPEAGPSQRGNALTAPPPLLLPIPVALPYSLSATQARSAHALRARVAGDGHDERARHHAVCDAVPLRKRRAGACPARRRGLRRRGERGLARRARTPPMGKWLKFHVIDPRPMTWRCAPAIGPATRAIASVSRACHSHHRIRVLRLPLTPSHAPPRQDTVMEIRHVPLWQRLIVLTAAVRLPPESGGPAPGPRATNHPRAPTPPRPRRAAPLLRRAAHPPSAALRAKSLDIIERRATRRSCA